MWKRIADREPRRSKDKRKQLSLRLYPLCSRRQCGSGTTPTSIRTGELVIHRRKLDCDRLRRRKRREAYYCRESRCRDGGWLSSSSQSNRRTGNDLAYWFLLTT